MNAVADFWDKHEDEHHKTENISCKHRDLAHSPDLIAMLILDRHFPSRSDMVSATGHDEFYLKVSGEKLFNKKIKVPEEDILDLIRCGLNYDSYTDSFYFFT